MRPYSDSGRVLNVGFALRAHVRYVVCSISGGYIELVELANRGPHNFVWKQSPSHSTFDARQA